MELDDIVEKKSYVYGHYKADTGELFYIGKGIANRAWEIYGRNPYWKNVVNKHGYTIQILYDNLSEQEAFEKEKELIDEVGLENLTNIVSGGKGMTSDDAKRLSNDPEWRKKITEHNRRLAKDPIWLEKNKKNRENIYKNPKFLKSRIEATNHLRKICTLLATDGTIHHVCGISEFCKKHGLDKRNTLAVIRGDRLSHKGWRLYKPEENYKISES
jgi:hypothetical protein